MMTPAEILDPEGKIKDRAKLYLEWCLDQGVVMPKLEYPSHFQGGLIGIGCKEDIEHREAAMFVPLKITITLKKALTHPVLSNLIK